MKCMKSLVFACLILIACSAGASPVAHWKFDGNAEDSAGSNDGTAFGSKWVGGQIDGAAYFDGEDDYVEFGDTVKNSLGTAYTVTAWVRPSSLTAYPSGTFAGYRHSGLLNPVFFQLDHEGDDVRFTIRDNNHIAGEAVFSNVLETDTWFHVAGVRDGDMVTVYVNGEQGTTVNRNFGSIIADNLKAGALIHNNQPPGGFFHGLIDDLRVYDRGLSGEEVLALVPEPMSVLLFGLGGFAVFRRRQ